MAKNYKTGIIITGDGKGGIKAVEATENSLKRFERQTKKTGKSSKEMGEMVASSAKKSGAAITAMVAAGAAYTAYNANQIKQQYMFAEAIGVSNQALSSMAYAARDTQITNEKLGDILKDTSEKIGEAYAEGSGEAVEALEALNLSASDLVGLSADQQLFAIADALQDVGTQSEKIALTEKLASDFSLLLPLMEDGAEGLKAAQYEAEVLGVSLSDIDSSMIAQASSDVGRLTASFSGFGNLMTAQIVPSLGAVSGAIVDATIESDGLRESTDLLGDVYEWIFELGLDVVSNVRDIGDAYEALQYKIGLVYAILNTEVSFSTFEDMANHVESYNQAIDEIYKKNAQFDKELREGYKRRVSEYKGHAQYQAMLNEQTAEFKNETKSSAKTIELKTKQLEKEQKEWDGIADSILDVIEAEQQANQELENRKQAAADWLASEAQWRKDMFDLGFDDASMEAADKLLEQEKELIEQRTKEYEQMVERIDGVFVDVWRDVIDGTDNAFDAISNMFKQLLAEMAHQAITKPIMISVMGSMGLTPANAASAVMGNSGSFGLGSIGSFFTGGDLFSGSIGSAAASAIGYTMGYGGVAAGSQAAMLASQTAAFGTAGSSLTAGAAGASSAGLGSSFMAAAPYIAGFLALDALMGGKITSGIVTGITGGDWEYRDHGMTLDASRSGVDADSYLYERKDGGWFRSSRGRTTYSDMPEFEAAYSLVVKGMLDQLDANANDLGYDLADNFSTTFKTSFKNMDDAEIEQAIADSLTSVYRDAVESIAGLSDYLDDFQYSGEELYQTLARVTRQTHAVSDLLGLTNQEFGSVTSRVFDFSSGYIKGLINWAQNPVWKTVAADANLVAQNLIELSGGLDALSASTATYYQAFFTEEEKFTRLTSELTTALSSQNLALPATREEYRALLESLNLGGEAAQEQYVALLQLSGVANSYYSEIESREAELNEQRLAAIEEQAALELAALEAQEDAIRAQEDALNGLMATLNSVYGDVIGSTSVNANDYMNAQSSLATAVSMAQSGRAVSVSDIESALSVVSNNDIASYASRLDYERDQLITAGYISQLSSLLDGNIGLINGSHATGLASVPFDGYIAQTHKDESIIDARTMQGLRRYGVPVQQSNNRELVQELKRLQELVKQMGNQMHKDNAQVISISDKTSRLLKKFDVDGMPEVRNV